MDWSSPANAPPKPNKTGVVVYDDFPLEDVLDCIDWNPFFQVCSGCCGAPAGVKSMLTLRLFAEAGAFAEVVHARGRGVTRQQLRCTKLLVCGSAVLPRCWAGA